MIIKTMPVLRKKKNINPADLYREYTNIWIDRDECLKPNFEVADQDYYRFETTTCTFLNRDYNGNYKFIHKSFMEYFIAESFYWHLRQYNTQIIDYSSLNKEIKFFLKYVIALDLRDAKLQGIYLWGSYLRDADLSGANLSGTNLNKEDKSSDPKQKPDCSIWE